MKPFLAVVLVAAVAGCGGGPNLSFSVRAGSPSAAPRNALVAGTGIVLDRVRVVIRKVELEQAGTAEMSEVASGPYLLDLSSADLDSGTVSKGFIAPRRRLPPRSFAE